MLETDRINLVEHADASVRLAVRQYRARLADKEPRQAAYAQALAYLRRKTQWGPVIAAAALDAELAIVPVLPDQSNSN